MERKSYNEYLEDINILLKRTYYEIYIACMNLELNDVGHVQYFEPEESLPFELGEIPKSVDTNVQYLLNLYLQVGKTVLVIENSLGKKEG